MTLASINPATGEQVAEFDEHSVDEVERRISASCDAFRNWSARSVEERAAVLMRLAGLLESEQETLGRLMTLEMGKTLRAARDEAVINPGNGGMHPSLGVDSVGDGGDAVPRKHLA